MHAFYYLSLYCIIVKTGRQYESKDKESLNYKTLLYVAVHNNYNRYN